MGHGELLGICAIINTIKHGTVRGYSHYKCRCEECKRAKSEYKKRYRSEIRVPKKIGICIEGIIHGTLSSYDYCKCRCEDCRKAKNEYKKGYKAGIRIDRETWNQNISKAAQARPISSRLSGSDNGNWKGDNVGYFGIHSWIRKYKEKTGICQHCNKNVGIVYPNSTHFANKDHQYKRDLEDYMELCPSCHKKYDYKLSVR